MSLLNAKQFVSLEMRILEDKQSPNSPLLEILNEIKGYFSKVSSHVNDYKTALNHNTPPEVLRDLSSKHSSGLLLKAIGQNPSTPFDVAEEIYLDKRNGVSALSLLSNPGVTHDFINSVVMSAGHMEMEAILKHDLPIDVLEKISKRKDLDEIEFDPYYEEKSLGAMEADYDRHAIADPSTLNQPFPPYRYAEEMLMYKIQLFRDAEYTPSQLDDLMYSKRKNANQAEDVPTSSNALVFCAGMHRNASLDTTLNAFELLMKRDVDLAITFKSGLSDKKLNAVDNMMLKDVSLKEAFDSVVNKDKQKILLSSGSVEQKMGVMPQRKM